MTVFSRRAVASRIDEHRAFVSVRTQYGELGLKPSDSRTW
jgi:hypothetical protein